MIGYLEKTITIIPLDFEIGDEGSFISQITGELNARFLLSKLNEIQRQIITKKIEGFKINEIAGLLNQRPRQISYTLLKIRQTIRLLNPQKL